MKKMIVLPMFLVFFALPAYSQFTIGIEAGVSYINEDTQEMKDMGFDVSQVGMPAMLEVGYRLPRSIDVPGIGPSNIVAGLKFGYMNGTSAEADISVLDPSLTGGTWDIYWYTIPVYLFGRAEAGNFFTDLSLGVHAWTMESEVDSGNSMMDSMLSYSDNGLDFSADLKLGLIFRFSDMMNARAGISLKSLTIDTEDDDDSMFAIGAFAGFNFNL